MEIPKTPPNPYKRDRYCLYCGKKLEDNGSYLYYQSFCSEECKRKYVKGE
ncbi:MAG: hypothetical protein J7L14_00510 [Candidatus Diapherotrites archaeon]|nr:hypothetical protein [Candidatus Diapherotrites archaeon]